MTQDSLSVSCFGVPASYSDQAMQSYFRGKNFSASYRDHFEDVIADVAEGRAVYGVVPIENSSTGGITEVYDLIRKYGVSVVGEKCIKIEHHLLALPGAKLEDIKTVYSHPQGFAQCREFFNKHPNWQKKPYFSTSKSAEKVAEDGSLDQAAVASRLAGELYGLSVLVPEIYSNKTNYTRFFIIAADDAIPADADTITLVIAVRHEPGALYHVLGYFFYGGMNMTHLESRPMEGKPFEYFFHIDVSGRLDDPAVAHTLKGLSSMCTYFRVLGNYAQDRESRA